jgi:hypothetical protein
MNTTRDVREGNRRIRLVVVVLVGPADDAASNVATHVAADDPSDDPSDSPPDD